MKHLLLIGSTTGYQTRSFLEAAQRLGFKVTLATDRCHVMADPWGDHALPIRFESAEESAQQLSLAGPFDGIVGLGDRAAFLASLAAPRLGIHYNHPDAVARCKNKFLARESFRQANLLTPAFERLPLDTSALEAAASANYPCVLKPLGLSGSRGVIRADNPEQFVAAFERISALLRDPDIARLHDSADHFVQVEEFIPGREFAVEGILESGNFRLLAIFDKPDPLDGPYFEETLYITPSRETQSVQQDIELTTQKAARALGLTEGPLHAEMRVNQRGVWMLEVAARPIGGLCARVLPGLEELILRRAAGQINPSLQTAQPAAGVMMIPIPKAGIYAHVSGVETASATPLIEDVVITAKEGQRLVPLPEGSSYLGFIFARGARADRVEAALRQAHACLKFEILKALPVVG